MRARRYRQWLSGLSVSGDSSKPAQSKAAEAPAKKVKILPEDVTFLVDHFEVSKIVATKMLREAEGRREKAVEDFVLPKPTAVAGSA